MARPPRSASDVSRPRYPEIDFVRGVATILVVTLHAAVPVLYSVETTPGDVWATHNAVDAALRVCVPLFFMMTGFLLLGPPAGARSWYRELGLRLLRLVLPLATWGLVYKTYIAYHTGVEISAGMLANSFLELFRGAPVYHLWFLYQLVVLYLLVPIFRALCQAPRPVPTYFIGLWLFLALVDLVMTLTGAANWVSSHLVLGSSGYLVAGFLIRQWMPRPSRRITAAAVAGYIACTIATGWLTWSFSKAHGVFVETFYVYPSFLVIVQSLCAFIFLVKLGQWISASAPAFSRFFAALASVSFGIFFVHVLFLERIQYNIFGRDSHTSLQALAAIAATTLFALAVSWLTAWILSRFRFTRWLVS